MKWHSWRSLLLPTSLSVTTETCGVGHSHMQSREALIHAPLSIFILFTLLSVLSSMSVFLQQNGDVTLAHA